MYYYSKVRFYKNTILYVHVNQVFENEITVFLKLTKKYTLLLQINHFQNLKVTGVKCKLTVKC